MYKIQHVQQQMSGDCTQACISMVTGIPLEALTEKYNSKVGMSKEDAYYALKQFGIECEIPRFNMLKYGCTYIATVASLNIKGGLHCIVFDCRWWKDIFEDDDAIFDPNAGREGLEAYDKSNIRSWCDLIKVVPKKVDIN